LADGSGVVSVDSGTWHSLAFRHHVSSLFCTVSLRHGPRYRSFTTMVLHSHVLGAC
jgi:hypothetical protein